MKKMLNRGLYAITDDTLDERSLLDRTEQILSAGVTALQYRDKLSDPATCQQRAFALQQLCRKYQVPFIVNDDIQLAEDVSADGIHLGRDDAGYEKARDRLGPDTIIGISCYNLMDRAIATQKMGADYIAFGAFFPTTTKSDTTKATKELLINAKKEICLPIVAIGGITQENGKSLLAAGADILAVISSVYHTDEPKRAVQRFNELFNSSSL